MFHRRGAVRQQARRLDARRIVDELRADALERADWLAELLPFEGVVSRGFVRPLRKADGERRNADAPRIEHLQRVDEPLPFLAEHLETWHAAVLEDHLARLARAHAQLVFFLP